MNGVNKSASLPLRKATGLDVPQNVKGYPHHDTDDLAGALGKEEANRMLRALKKTRRIEPNLWK